MREARILRRQQSLLHEQGATSDDLMHIMQVSIGADMMHHDIKHVPNRVILVVIGSSSLHSPVVLILGKSIFSLLYPETLAGLISYSCFLRVAARGRCACFGIDIGRLAYPRSRILSMLHDPPQNPIGIAHIARKFQNS